MTTAPQTLAEEIAQHRRDYGGTEEEAAAVIIPRRARAAELSESTDPAVLLPAIRDRLRLAAKIERIVKTMSTPIYYRIETDAGTVALGPSNRWATRPAEFAAAFLDIGEMRHLPKDREERAELCTMIARAAEPEDVGEEATDAGWMRAALRHYLDNRPPVTDLDEAASSEYPWINDAGRTAIHGPGFRRWLLFTYQERLTPADFGRRLRAVGCAPDRLHVTVAGKPTTVSAWWLPDNLDG